MGAFWGMVPDFFPAASIIYFMYLGLGLPNDLGLFNSFLFSDGLPIYLFSHSLTPYVVVSASLFLLKKKHYWLPAAGGGLHLLVDILTHGEGTVRTFYPLYPFQELSFTARYFSDEDMVFVALCWSILLLVYLQPIIARRLR